MQLERLQKIIAHAGFASRREAEAMIREGRVTVNGKVVTELGTRADAERDHVKVDGKLITHAEEHRYILLYKPKEVMTTVEDPQRRKTVIDLVKGVRERIYPVGRLDYHSEGLIILTNDGDLAFKVSHPKHGSVKTYHVKVRGVPEERIIEKLERGITIDGKRTLPCEIRRMKTTGRGDDAGNSWFEVKLREGRTQQIRKMFQAVGHPVSKLRRVAIGPISDPDLSPGEWRELTRAEVRKLDTIQDAPREKAKPVRARAASKKAPAAKAPAKKRATALTSRGNGARPKSATTSRGPASRGTSSREASPRGTSSRGSSSRATGSSRKKTTAGASRATAGARGGKSAPSRSSRSGVSARRGG